MLGLMKTNMRRYLKVIDTKSKNVSHEITVHDKYVPTTDNIDNFKFNDIQVNHYLARYYQKKDNNNFNLTNENKFMNILFWKRIHEHLINNRILPNDGCKYKICQVLREDNEFAKYVEDDGSFFIKESRFNYSRPIDGTTRLMVYNRQK